MSEASCPKCHAHQIRRVKQHGFLQQSVLRRLGFYPWECRFCKAAFVLRDRGLAINSPSRRHTPLSTD